MRVCILFKIVVNDELYFAYVFLSFSLTKYRGSTNKVTLMYISPISPGVWRQRVDPLSETF